MFYLINLISISIKVIQMKMICFEEFIKFFLSTFFLFQQIKKEIRILTCDIFRALEDFFLHTYIKVYFI